MDSLKCVEYVDEKRTISAYYHEKLRSGARVGIMYSIRKSLKIKGFRFFFCVFGCIVVADLTTKIE